MTTTETPAAELREAAALLREHVDAATPGRWHHMCLGSEGCQVLNDGHLRERKWGEGEDCGCEFIFHGCWLWLMVYG